MKKEALSISRCSLCDETVADRVICTKCGKQFEMVCLDFDAFAPVGKDQEEKNEKQQANSSGNDAPSDLYVHHNPKILIEWSEKYELGLKEIDDQHHGIADLINRIHESVNSGARDHDFVLKVLKSLDKYVAEHFAYEEKLFRAAKYPGIDQQMREHRIFSAQVKELHTQFEKSFFDLRSVLRFMVGWFMEHTQGSDKDFVAYWKEQAKKVAR